MNNVPNDADIHTFELFKNDIIILASDGLWDNIINYDIHKIIRNLLLYKKTNLCSKYLVELSKSINIADDDIMVIAIYIDNFLKYSFASGYVNKNIIKD